MGRSVSFSADVPESFSSEEDSEEDGELSPASKIGTSHGSSPGFSVVLGPIKSSVQARWNEMQEQLPVSPVLSPRHQ